MNIFNLQRGLLDWFWLEKNETRTLRSIESICANLFAEQRDGFSINSLSSRELSEIILPLFRFGVIESYGKNKFGLSPTCSIARNNLLLLCNVQRPIIDQFKHLCTYNNHLGVTIYKRCNELELGMKKNEIPGGNFDLLTMLKRFSSLNDIIQSWEDHVVIDSSSFFYLTAKYKWSNTPIPPARGIFKKSDEVYSQRVLKTSNDEWKLIPNRYNNIDALNLAINWVKAESNNLQDVKYYISQEILILTGPSFPLVIERLLLFNTLLSNKFYGNLLERHYYVSNEDFEILNKFFHNKIPAHE